MTSPRLGFVLSACLAAACTGAIEGVGDDGASDQLPADEPDAADLPGEVDGAPGADGSDDEPGEPDAAPGEVDAALPAADCVGSELYGRLGELYDPAGRLIDVGYVGYHTGLDPIPDVAGPVTSVTDFGAVGDDANDDTAAFLAAIAATNSGVISIPAGRFIVQERLEIKKPNLVIRGAGQGQTVLFFPKSLGDVYGLTFNGAGQSNYSFVDGFIKVTGRDAGAQLATITADQVRGNRTLKVSSTTGLTVGQTVRVVQKDSNGTLFAALHEGEFPGNAGEDGGKEVFHFYSKVEAVADGQITLERALPFAVDTRWSPEVRAAQPTVKEVGVEDLTLEFKGTVYPGHFKETGFNAIHMIGVHDSWVRRVTIINADYGVNLSGSFFSTVSEVTFDTNFDRGDETGHHGLNSSGGNDLLFTRFDFKVKYVHDLTVDGYAMATVFSDGKGVDLNMDHHGRAPYGTLWTNLDFGAGNRPFASGGSAQRLPHSAAYSTFWNLTADKDMKLPANDFGPRMNFVAVRLAAGSGRAGWKIETIDAAALCQPDLHAFMLQKRRAE